MLFALMHWILVMFPERVYKIKISTCIKIISPINQIFSINFDKFFSSKMLNAFHANKKYIAAIDWFLFIERNLNKRISNAAACQ